MAYEQMEVLEIFDEFETKMNKSISSLQYEFNNIKAGRANPHILDKNCRRLLRRSHSFETNRQHSDSRGESSYDYRMGYFDTQGSREGYYCRKYGNYA